MRGKLIAFEGVDGSGKGTQLQKAHSWLCGKVDPSSIVLTKEPGGTKFGDLVRKLMFTGVPMAELVPGVVDLMFLSSHIQNWHTVVLPALRLGKVVLTDRWWYSQEAYGSERKVPPAVRNAYDECKGIRADLLLFFVADVDVAIERARAREEETHQSSKAWNDAQVQKDVQSEYLRLFENSKEFREVLVNRRDAESIFVDVKKILSRELNIA